MDETPETDAIRDLHLDKVFTAVCGADDPFRLTPLCRHLLEDADLIRRRQAVFEDLARPEVHDPITAFARAMSAVDDLLAPRTPRPVPVQRHRLQIAAAETYCVAVDALVTGLHDARPHSALLRRLGRLLRELAESPDFTGLRGATGDLQHRLRALRFVVHLNGSRITVGRFDDEPNYETEIVDLFARSTSRRPTRTTCCRGSPAGPRAPRRPVSVRARPPIRYDSGS